MADKIKSSRLASARPSAPPMPLVVRPSAPPLEAAVAVVRLYPSLSSLASTASRTRPSSAPAQPAEAEMTKLVSVMYKQLATEGGDPFALDLCFLFDGTGSMRSSIAAVVSKIFSIVQMAQKMLPKYAIRIGYVVYRDTNDTNPTETQDFTDNVEAFTAALRAVRAEGGGDTAEDVLTGLEAALSLDWRSEHRILLHIADAPNHGTLYHEGVSDDQPQCDPKGFRGKGLMQGLATTAIDYYFVELHASTRKMVDVFAGHYNAKARKALHKFSVKQPDKELAKHILRSIRDSVSGTSTRRKGGFLEADGVEYVLQEAAPEWGGVGDACGAEQAVELFAMPAVQSLAELLGDGLLKPARVGSMRLRLSKLPFALGATRRVHYALADGALRFVAKIWNVRGEEDAVHELNCASARCLAVARFFERPFNARAERAGLKTRVRFLETYVCRAAVGEAGRPVWMSLEPFIGGEAAFVKYNSNSGFVLGEGEESEAAQAFSHFSFCGSRCQLLVADLQGGGLAQLTDPAIHFSPAGLDLLRTALAARGAPAPSPGPATATSAAVPTLPTALNRRAFKGGEVPFFSMTDLGKDGFADFFRTHACGPTCRALGIAL